VERLEANPPLRVGGRTLVTIQRVRVEHRETGDGAWVGATAEPRALVVVEGGRPRALDALGAEVALEPFLRDVPGLAEVLRTID